MNKLIKPACLLMLLYLLSGCQIYSLVKDATDREEGRIIMKDGKEYTGRVKMPNCNTRTIRISTPEGKVKLKNTDIAVLGVWKKKHTDLCHYLVCLPYETNKLFSTKKKKQVKPQWMAMEAQGEHVEFYCCSYNYSIPSDGTLKITSVQNGNILFIARKKDDSIGQIIGYQGSGSNHWRTLLTEYLADDPELCQKLKNKEIEPSDLQKIADLYNPQQP